MILAALAVAAAMLNPAVTPATVATTVCVPNWTAAARPTKAQEWNLKRKLLALRPGAKASDYTLDHIVAISVGGSPFNPANLQLQTVAEAKRKDVLEASVHRAVCAHRMALADAQAALVAWK